MHAHQASASYGNVELQAVQIVDLTRLIFAIVIDGTATICFHDQVTLLTLVAVNTGGRDTS